MKKTYIVTGIMRSGTSMMMRALYEGLGREVPVLASDEREKVLNEGRDEVPNHEYLEPPMTAVMSPFFPRPYEGHLIKILNAGTYPMWPVEGELRTVQMWRDPVAIKESWERHSEILGDPPGWIPDGYGMRMRLNTALLLNRKDVVSHTDLWYEMVLEDPKGAADFLIEQGWPITDIEAFVSVIDAGKRKYRGRELEIPEMAHAAS